MVARRMLGKASTDHRDGLTVTPNVLTQLALAVPDAVARVYGLDPIVTLASSFTRDVQGWAENTIYTELRYRYASDPHRRANSSLMNFCRFHGTVCMIAGWSMSSRSSMTVISAALRPRVSCRSVASSSPTPTTVSFSGVGSSQACAKESRNSDSRCPVRGSLGGTALKSCGF
jgi:hypothetical protein